MAFSLDSHGRTVHMSPCRLLYDALALQMVCEPHGIPTLHTAATGRVLEASSLDS